MILIQSSRALPGWVCAYHLCLWFSNSVKQGRIQHNVGGCYLGESKGATLRLGWAPVGSEGPGTGRLDGPVTEDHTGFLPPSPVEEQPDGPSLKFAGAELWCVHLCCAAR